VWLFGYTTIASRGDQVCYRKLEVYSEDWDAQESLVTEQPGMSENYLLPAPSKRKMPPWIADPLIDDLDDQVSLNPHTITNPRPAFWLRISVP